jgi:hypothetical protein
LVSIQEIERLTGLNLLPRLDRAALKEAVASELWPRNWAGEEFHHGGLVPADCGSSYQREFRYALQMLALALVLLAATGCAPTIRSQVLDAQTGQPIAGAVILGVWTKGGGVPGLSHTDLVGVREAETDAEGHFELERVWGLLLDDKRITVYKFGYIAWSNQAVFPSFARRDDTGVPAQIRLAPFPPEDSHGNHMGFVRHSTGVLASGYAPLFWKAVRPEELMR